MTGAAEDPHTIDEYMDALRFAAPRLPAGVDAVRRLVWGARGGRAPTELALEELVAQGRATRTDGWRYRARSVAPVEDEDEREARALVSRGNRSLLRCEGVRPSSPPAADAVVPDLYPPEHPQMPCVIPDLDAMPPVCPGCHAVGEEPRASGCIDAELEAEHREALESGDYDVGIHEDECDDCDGSGTYFINGEPWPCICSEPQDAPVPDDDESDAREVVHDAPAETTPEASAVDDDREPDAEVVQALLPPPRFETLADVAAKWADPESVVAAARELRPRLEAARERLRQRLSERMAVVTADRELLVELDGYSQALGGGDS